MTTFYTSDVSGGKVTDFNTFALKCARAFLVETRDSDGPIPRKIKPSNHSLEVALEAEAELARIKALTPLGWEAEWKADRRKVMDAHQKHVDERKAAETRLLAMRTKVADWNPPTLSHRAMKDFMVAQIDETIEFDCRPDDYHLDQAKEISGSEWRKLRLKELKDRISSYKKYHDEELRNTASRNKWVAELLDSLKV